MTGLQKSKLYEKQSGAWNVSRIPQELPKLPGLLEWKNNTTINNLHVVVSSKHEPFSQLDPPYVSWTNPPILSQFWWPERWPTEFSSHFPSALTHCGAWPPPCAAYSYVFVPRSNTCGVYGFMPPKNYQKKTHGVISCNVKRKWYTKINSLNNLCTHLPLLRSWD